MIAIAVHAGAAPDSKFIRDHQDAIKAGILDALTAGYKAIEEGDSAVDGAEAAVKSLEDNPLFNAGKGSMLNNLGQVEMDAAIMDGRNREAGAVTLVNKVRNPVSLARYIMEETDHVLMAGPGAVAIGDYAKLQMEPDEYFLTEHSLEEYKSACQGTDLASQLKQKVHGTVGAVAVDNAGNVAAATSTGGTTNCLQGRVGDSCIIGSGCFADNKICAVSGTGDGEFLIRSVIAHAIAAEIELAKREIQEACDHVIHDKNKNVEGDLGVISLNAQAQFGISFNSETMIRGWLREGDILEVKIYRD